MSGTTELGAIDRGRVDRLVRRLYARLGSRVMYATVAGGYVCGVGAASIVVVIGSRFLGVSAGQILSLWPLIAVVLALTVLGLVPSRGQFRTILAWPAGSPGRGDSVATWFALVRWRDTVTRVVLAGFVATPAISLFAVVHFHRPWYALPMLIVDFAGVFAGLWIVAAFGAMLVLRPMLEEVATQLPEGFSPGVSGISLRSKAVGPLPVVTFLTAGIVGAFAHEATNPTARAAIATGVALATVLVAAGVFTVIHRSVLAPVDDLIAATERVRRGDIATPVRPLSDDELGALAVSFNRMLGELRVQSDELRSSRERIVATADAERRRMERDLHDGAQQFLLLAKLKLNVLTRAAAAGTPVAPESLRGLAAELDRALGALRELAHGLYPPQLQERGLPGALREAALRAAIPTSVVLAGLGRYEPELEAAVYFVCVEALQNAGKHAGPGACATVTVRERGGELRFAVRDDGVGFTPAPGRAAGGVAGGLVNMGDRVGALGGQLEIASAPGRGTTILGTLPVPRVASPGSRSC